MDIFFFPDDFYYGPCRAWTRPEIQPDPDLSKER